MHTLSYATNTPIADLARKSHIHIECVDLVRITAGERVA